MDASVTTTTTSIGDPPISPDVAYRDEQIAHVTGHAGSSSVHILCILLQLPILTFLLKVFCNRFSTRRSTFVSFWLEFVVLAIYPVLMVSSPLADHSLWVLFIGVVVSYFVWLVIVKPASHYEDSDVERSDVVGSTNSSSNSNITSLFPMFITYFRACTTLLTIVSILAVDFNVFPRNLAKTEWFGMSLMDLGTGIFIFSSALTSSYARATAGTFRTISSASASDPPASPPPPPPPPPPASPPPSSSPSLFHSPPYTLTANSSSSSASPLFSIFHVSRKTKTKLVILLLGFGRLLVLKVFSYQEHVSEYGVHWNFFVTLFLVWTLADTFRYVVKVDSIRQCVSILMLCLYQYYLVVGSSKEDGMNPLSTYIFSTDRNNFIAANKEGIYSLFGYLPLYIVTECFSRANIFNRVDCVVERERKRSSAMLGLIFISSFVYVLSANYVQSPSRRLMNMAFVSLIILFCCTSLYLVSLVDSKIPPEHSFRIHFYTLLSENQLFIFLLANVMTGCVNMSMQTIHVNDCDSTFILITYTGAVLLVSHVLCNVIWISLKESTLFKKFKTRKPFN